MGFQLGTLRCKHMLSNSVVRCWTDGPGKLFGICFWPDLQIHKNVLGGSHHWKIEWRWRVRTSHTSSTISWSSCLAADHTSPSQNSSSWNPCGWDRSINEAAHLLPEPSTLKVGHAVANNAHTGSEAAASLYILSERGTGDVDVCKSGFSPWPRSSHGLSKNWGRKTVIWNVARHTLPSTAAMWSVEDPLLSPMQD